ncbi:MAG: hypothetical protein AAGG08_01030 [Actinomycetota bacterium]
MTLRETVRADHRALVDNQRRYAGRTDDGRLIVDLVRNVGFQQLALHRVAAAAHRRRRTGIAMILSRLGRHLFGSDLHWTASIDPGVVIVHGAGLVISGEARVGAGCVLSQQVTLGTSRGVDGRDGAPRLGTGVHVGPGAVIVGPVEIGADSKIAPTTLVTFDVPEHCVVSPAPAEIVTRPMVRTTGAVADTAGHPTEPAHRRSTEGADR